jgi:hypothetical protein
VEAFMCKEITNFSSMYFSCANNENASTTQYHVVRNVPLNELSIFQWKGIGVGAPSTQYITDKEWAYSMLYMYSNMEEVEPYFEKFDKNIFDILCATYIEATASHVLAWAQTWSKLSEVVLTTCHLSLHPFSFLILLHQSCNMCNIVYSFICSV